QGDRGGSRGQDQALTQGPVARAREGNGQGSLREFVPRPPELCRLGIPSGGLVVSPRTASLPGGESMSQRSDVCRPERAVLPNGLTVLTEILPDRRSVSIGLWLRRGARDEPGALMGVSHFLEHMLFKGTERRSAYEIANSLESRGGHLD